MTMLPAIDARSNWPAPLDPTAHQRPAATRWAQVQRPPVLYSPKHCTPMPIWTDKTDAMSLDAIAAALATPMPPTGPAVPPTRAADKVSRVRAFLGAWWQDVRQGFRREVLLDSAPAPRHAASSLLVPTDAPWLSLNRKWRDATPAQAAAELFGPVSR